MKSLLKHIETHSSGFSEAPELGLDLGVTLLNGFVVAVASTGLMAKLALENRP